MSYQIIQGDCLEVLRTLESESVQCCVTSPPYFGLRDYGTADWQGGDAECDHKGDERYYTMRGASSVTAEAFSEAGDANAERLKKARWREKGTCIHCGAIRVDSQIGLEETPAAYVAKMVEVFEEVRRVLRPDGTLWLNLGDSYAGGKGQSGSGGSEKQERRAANGESFNRGYQTLGGAKQTRPTDDMAALRSLGLKPKDLIGIPWRVAFALQEAGWWLRQDIIWAKPNPMPESVTDRCTKAHEYIFLLTKSAKYYYDNEAVKEPMAMSSISRLSQDVESQIGSDRVPGKTNGPMKAVGVRDRSLPRNRNRITGSLDDVHGADRNKRSVWTVTTRPFKDAHFATFPPKLIEPCILAGTSEYGACADCGSPYKRVTTVVSKQITEAMKVAGCDTNGEYQGQATKDYASGKAQNASDTKRRILESMSQVKESSWQKTCKCETDKVVPCVVLDPFNGAGTTGIVSLQHRRRYLGIELNESYIEISQRRISEVQVNLF